MPEDLVKIYKTVKTSELNEFHFLWYFQVLFMNACSRSDFERQSKKWMHLKVKHEWNV